MTMDAIRKALKAEPFEPFTVSLTDGRRFSVKHPEFIWIPPEASRTFHIAGKGEDYSVISLLLVTSIDFGNGADERGKRRGKTKG